MITKADIERLNAFKLPHLTISQIRRITNAERACKDVQSEWGKAYWFDVFRKLCEKYGVMDYFRKTIH